MSIKSEAVFAASFFVLQIVVLFISLIEYI